MKKYQKITLLLIIFSFAFSGLVSAQNSRRIYRDFIKVEIYMAKVWELVNRFDDRRAIELMGLAKLELDKARQYLYRIQPNFAQGLVALAKAKNFTDLAARRVLSKPFYNLKSQLDELINQAEKAVSNSSSDEAHYLLNQAKKFRRLAYHEFSNSRIGKGEEYYRISFFFGRKCIDYVKNSSTNLSEQYENLELSVRQLLGQGEELIMSGERDHLRKIFSEAEKHFEEAVLLAEEGKLQMAISRLRLIERLLYRVFDQAERGILSDEVRIENNLYTLRSLLDALQGELNNSKNRRAEKLLSKSWQLYNEAERAYQEKNYELSRAKISLCQRFANNLFRMTRVSTGFDKNSLEEQLKETQNLLELQRERIAITENKNLVYLHEEASQLLKRANQAIESDRLGVAFQLIQAATRMSSRIQRELRQTSSNFEVADLERKYQQIINTVGNLESNPNLLQNQVVILNQIKRFAEEGMQHLNEGKLILAEEYINTAWEQIKQYSNKWRK
jgi:hypothetical protein